MKYLSKTIEYALYLLVFLLPVQTRWIIKPGLLNGGPWEYGTYSLYATDILLVFILFLFMARRFLERGIKNHESGITNLIQNSKFKIQNYLIFGLLLFSLISLFSAAEKQLALFKLGWLVLGAGLYWLVTRADYHRARLVWSFLAGAALQAVLAIWQFFWQTTWPSKWLGLALHRAGDLGTSVIETLASDGVAERWLRAYGGLDHPNMLGGVMAIGILLLVGEIIRINQDEQIPNSNNQIPNKSQIPITKSQTNPKYWNIKMAGQWLLLILFAAALFFSFSRSAWLGLALGVIIILAGAIIGKDLRQQKSLSQAVLIVGLISFVLFLSYPHLAVTRLYALKSISGGSVTRLEEKSLSERHESLKLSWPLAKNHWLAGAGLGNYTLALRHELKPEESSYYYQPVHNVFLLVWAEAGIFGLLFFILLILSLVIKNYLEIRNSKLEIRNNEDVKFAIVNLSILIVLIVSLTLDHWLWSLHFGVFFFWLVLGLVCRNRELGVRD